MILVLAVIVSGLFIAFGDELTTDAQYAREQTLHVFDARRVVDDTNAQYRSVVDPGR